MNKIDYQYSGTELELFSHATRWKNYVASRIRPFLKGRILEVGSGLGANIPYLCGGEVKSWTALEPDFTLARSIPSCFNGIPITVLSGTLKDLPNELQFDSILYYDVLEHIADDEKELLQATQYLAKDGFIIILSPAHSFLYTAFDQSIGHVRRYNKNKFLQIKPKNMHYVKLEYLDSCGFFLSLGNKLILQSSMPNLRQIKFWDQYIVPISKFADKLCFFHFGKSILCILTDTIRKKDHAIR